MSGPRVQLLARSGCHLCQTAAAELDRLSGPLGFRWAERLVSEDRELEARFGEYVPVLLVDGRVIGWYRVDADRLAAALRAPAPPPAGTPPPG